MGLLAGFRPKSIVHSVAESILVALAMAGAALQSSRGEMKSPAVTVAIPTFDRPALLREALESVLRQDLKEFEVLVVDDASPCDVAAVVESFGDPRLRLIRQPRNVGMLRNWRTALCS